MALWRRCAREAEEISLLIRRAGMRCRAKWRRSCKSSAGANLQLSLQRRLNLAGAVTGVSRAIIRHGSAAFGMRRQVQEGQEPGFLGISTSGRLRERKTRSAISIAMVINSEPRSSTAIMSITTPRRSGRPPYEVTAYGRSPGAGGRFALGRGEVYHAG